MATSVQPASASPTKAEVSGMAVFVRGLRIDAQIGVYAHEHGRTQPLLVDVELQVAIFGAEQLGDTIDYAGIAARAQRIAAEGHLKLVEAYAERVARACLDDPRVLSARVRVEKPQALAPEAAGAGAEITVTRA